MKRKFRCKAPARKAVNLDFAFGGIWVAEASLAKLVWQVVVGTIETDATLQTFFDILMLSSDTCTDVIEFNHIQVSLIALGRCAARAHRIPSCA